MMTTAEKLVLLKFMEKTIDRVNTVLIHVHALEQMVLQKGLVTETELLRIIQDAKNLPDRLIGMETLKEMLEGVPHEKDS